LIPLRIRNGVTYYLGTLKAPLDPLDFNPSKEKSESWGGLIDHWNQYELLRTLSAGLTLFNLTQNIQKIVQDAQYKSIGLKTIHNIKSDIGFAKTRIEQYRNESNPQLLEITETTLERIRSRAEDLLIFEKKKEGKVNKDFVEIRVSEEFENYLELILSDVKYNNKIEMKDKLQFSEALTNQCFKSWISIKGSESNIVIESSFKIALMELLKNCIENTEGKRGLKIELDYSNKNFVLVKIWNSRPMRRIVLDSISNYKKKFYTNLAFGYGLKLVLDIFSYCGIVPNFSLNRNKETITLLKIPNSNEHNANEINRNLPR
jgi:signal transduction histidine kinase